MEDEEVAVVEGEGEAEVTAVADEIEEEEVDVVMGTEVQASTDTRIVMFDHFALANLTSEGLKAWFYYSDAVIQAFGCKYYKPP